MVECFMLQVEEKPIHTAILTPKDFDNHKCGDRVHRAEFAVGEATTFEQVEEKLPVMCQYCGKFQFVKANASVCIGHASQIYTNPKTGKSSHRVREVATPGAMWYCPWFVEDGDISSILSKEYRAHWLGKRAPICVSLPGGSDWVVDQQASNAEHGGGWMVTGDAPSLTAHPSIDAPGYHGWLRDGKLVSV